MGKPDKKQLRRQERRAQKAAEQRELATRNGEGEDTEQVAISAKDSQEMGVNSQSSSKPKGKGVERDEKNKTNGIKEPRWSTGLMSEEISCQPGGVARAYKHLGIDPKLDDAGVIVALWAVSAEVARFHSQGINVKARLGSILLVACSRSRDNADDPFYGLVDMLYLREANQYLATLSLPLPNSDSVKAPKVRVQSFNPPCRQAAPVTIDPGEDSNHLASTSQEDQIEKNMSFQKEIEDLRSKNLELLARLDVEPKGMERKDADRQKDLVQAQEEYLKLKEEVAKLNLAGAQAVQECLKVYGERDDRSRKSVEQEAKANQQIEDLRRAQEDDKRAKESLCDRVKELEAQKEQDSKSLKMANEKLKAMKGDRQYRSTVTPPSSSPSPAATLQKQTFEEVETEKHVSNGTELDEVKNLLTVQNQVTKELAEEVSKLRASQASTVPSLTDRKNFVIESLSKKVIDLSRQVKDQNDQFVNLMTVISESRG
ncbi:hypothetical protein JCM3765_006080 [Sporobolomyces pararoseus]